MAKRTKTRSGRFYTWGAGSATERYWSVTTILKALPKDALKWWAARTVAEEAVDRTKTWLTMSRAEAVQWLKSAINRTSSDAAQFGTTIHAVAEAYVLGKPIRVDFETDAERAAVGQFLDFLDTFKPEFLMAEAPVFSRTRRYAGQLDGIADFPIDRLDLVVHPWEPREGRDKVTLIIDYKTGGDVEEEKGVYPEASLQLCAYSRADFVGMPNGQEAPLPEIDGAAVVHVRPEGWRLVPVRIDDDVFESFLYIREVFRWLEVVSKDVLGVPIGAPPREAVEELEERKKATS